MMNYNKINVLTDVLNNGLTAENKAYFEQIVMRETAKREKRQAKNNAYNAAFRDELYGILLKHKDQPMTATQIQFEIGNFIARYITNQKVAHHLNRMMWKEDYPALARFAHRGKTFFIVGVVPPWADKPQEIDW